MPGGASGRSRRPSAADREGLASLGGNKMVDFLRHTLQATNAAKESESSAALKSVRVQARVAERQADRQFTLDERRENLESEVALRKVRVDEQRVAVDLQQARSVVAVKKLDTLKELYKISPSQAILDAIVALEAGEGTLAGRIRGEGAEREGGGET